MSTTEILDVLSAKGKTYLAHSFGADAAAGEIVESLRGVKEIARDAYMEMRAAFLSGKPAKMTDDAAQKQWERLYKASGHVIPKSQKADAIIKDAQREKEKAELKALDVPSIEKKVKALKDAGFDEKSAPVKKYTAELKRRDDEANAPILERVKAERKAIIEAIKAADVKTLDAVATLLKLKV